MNQHDAVLMHHLWDTVLTAAVSTQVNVSNVAALTTTGRLIAVVSTIVIAVAVERLHQAFAIRTLELVRTASDVADDSCIRNT